MLWQSQNPLFISIECRTAMPEARSRVWVCCRHPSEAREKLCLWEVFCRTETLDDVLWDPLSPCLCPRPEPAELAGCIYSLHVTTTNSLLVHRRYADDTLISHSGRCLTHLLCCDVDDDDFLLMGLVYLMPSTIMCTYQSYHDDTGQSDWLCFVHLSPGINPEWS